MDVPAAVPAIRTLPAGAAARVNQEPMGRQVARERAAMVSPRPSVAQASHEAGAVAVGPIRSASPTLLGPGVAAAVEPDHLHQLLDLLEG